MGLVKAKANNGSIAAEMKCFRVDIPLILFLDLRQPPP